MDRTLAQYIALALHGSVWLAEADRVEPPTLRGNSTFEHVGGVRFESAAFTCSDVTSWLAHLDKRGARRVSLVMPDFSEPPEDPSVPWHHRVALAGGLPVGMFVQTTKGGELWRSEWEVGDRTSADPWRVRYTGETTGLWAYCPPFGETWLELRSAVEEAATFAEARGLTPWDQIFVEALAQGVAERPSSAYADMAPDHGVTLERRRLLALATRAHVFGGIGSWNDRRFGDAGIQAEYDGISRRVFTASMYALASVVNVDPGR